MKTKESRSKLNTLLLVILIIIIGTIALLKIYPDILNKQNKQNKPIVFDEELTPEIVINIIKAEIKDIGELATIEYIYTNSGKFEDPKKIFGKNIPLTTKSFIAKWDGTIKAGVIIDKIIVSSSDLNKEIIIKLPKAEILSHEIDTSTIETLDEKDGLFNRVKVEDVRNFDDLNKKAMEERAIKHGILDKSLENAKAIIEKLVNNDVIVEQGYKIKFELPE